MTSDIQAEQERIAEEFAQCSDWEERYKRIIDLGKSLPEIPEEYMIDKYRVKGCQSTVYLHARLEDGRVVYAATSDAMIVRGLVALLMRIYSGRTPDEIIATPPEFIGRLGLNENLTQGRANGLASMVEQIKLYAVVFKQVAQAQGSA